VRAAGGDPVVAVLGPCIHPAHYEFGADLLARLVARFGPEVAGTTVDGRPALDVPAAVRATLAVAGVSAVTDVGVCTAASPDHFSARRDGTTGRQAVVVVRAR
jgi:copper oxidase (laccase) domain-containing protein